MKTSQTSDRVIAIIPARGGSKGIPRKNLMQLCGRPLIVWSIETARGSRCVDRVVVSTDDVEIADVSRSVGAEVVERPAAISGDHATSESALLHVLDDLLNREKYEPDLVVFLQATSPVRDAADIDAAAHALIDRGADSLFSACKEHFVGRWRATTDGFMLAENYDPVARPMRQDRVQTYVENGSIYIFRPSVLRGTGSRLGGRIAVYEMPQWKSFQIDEPNDLAVAEALMSHLVRNDDSLLASVRLLVCDFDGVMTDNRVLVDENGIEAVWCCRADGLGIKRLVDAGVNVAVLSTEENRVVAARCRKLNIPCLQGLSEKRAALCELAGRENLSPHEIAFVGNDLNDLECLRWVGAPVAVADAMPEVKAVAAIVLARRGGENAVRELADRVLSVRQGGIR